MKTTSNDYRRHGFPREIISHGVWLYHWFSLSLRDAVELLAKRGILVSYETIRHWCRKFGPEYARKLERRQGRLGDTWYLVPGTWYLDDGQVIATGVVDLPPPGRAPVLIDSRADSSWHGGFLGAQREGAL